MQREPAEKSHPGRRQYTSAGRILINAFSGLGMRLAMMAIGFLLTPFVVHSLGLQNYGLFSVIGTLAGYLGLLDFGLGGAFVKFITQYVEQGDKAAARQVISFGMLFYAVFGLILAVPVFFLAPYVVHMFKMPEADIPAAINLFRVIFAILVFTLALGIPGTVVVSMHRMDLASRNNFIGYLISAGVTVVMLRMGYGINGLVAAQAIQASVTAAIQYVTARRLFGAVWHNPLRFDVGVIRQLFVFGGWTQLTSVFTIVSLDVGRFLTAGVVSVSSVAYYELGSKLAFFSKSLPAYLLDAIMPAATAADAKSDAVWIDRMYAAGTFYSILAVIGLAGFIVGANDAIMRVWMGGIYPYVASITMFLAIGYAASGLTGVGTTILRASGLPRYETVYSAIAAAANLGSTIVLAPRFGVVGVAMGTSIGWCAGTLYFLTIYHKLRPSPWWSTIGSPALRLGASGLASAALVSWLIHMEPISRLFETRILGLAGLAAVGIVYLASYASLSWIAGAWRLHGQVLPRAFARLAA